MTEALVLLFTFSGLFKSLPLFRSSPVDLTLLLGVLVGGSLGWRLVTGGWRPSLSMWLGMALVLAWYFWTALSIGWSSGADAAVARLTRGLPLVVLAFLAGALVAGDSPARVRRVVFLFPALGLIALASTVFVLLNPGVESREAVGSNYIVRGVAMALGAMAALAVALTADGRVRSLRAVYGALGMCLSVAVLFSGSRQALLALIGGAVMLVIAMLRRGYRVSRILGGIGVVASVGVLGIAAASRAGIEVVTLSRLALTVQSAGGGRSLSTRAAHLRSVFESFGDHPVIGHGVGSFGYLFGESMTDYPHNLFAEVAFEGGLVGLCLLCLVVFQTAYRVRVSIERLEPAVRLSLLLTATVVTVNLLSSTTFVENRLAALMLGLLVGCGSPSHSGEPSVTPGESA